MDFVRTLKALADPLRLRVLAAVAEEELTVGEVQEVVASMQSSVSRNLAMLREAGFVRGRKEGTSVYFSVRADMAAPARELFKMLQTRFSDIPEIKKDRARTGTIMYVTLRAIDSLKVLFAPFLPFTCQRLHLMLGYSGGLLGQQIVHEYQEATRKHAALTYDYGGVTVQWKPSQLPVGQALGQVAPLFVKLDPKTADQERDKLGKPNAA